MISEIFGLLSTIEDTKKSGSGRFKVNMNRNRLRSISAFSSNSIFYFPEIVTSQATGEEVSMVSRMIEKSYASFVVACIGLMPFHRISADDKESIEDYLSQFHQNIGMNMGSGPIMTKIIGHFDQNESASDLGFAEFQNFLLESWQKSKETNTDFIKIIAETVSINDMYSEDALDSKTKYLQEAYLRNMEELETWGFLGEATDDLLDADLSELLNLSDDELAKIDLDDDDDDIDEDEYDDSILDENSIKSAIDKIKFSLEAVSANKILSCQKLTQLNALESKLKKLKNKYTKYLNRYKKKYAENQKSGSKSKLKIRFNNMEIGNPKAFMKQYGSYIKVINKRLALVEKRRLQLRKRKGLEESANTLTDMDISLIDYCDSVITKDLNASDDEIFSISEDASDYEQSSLAQKEIEGYRKRAEKAEKTNKKLKKENKKLSKKSDSNNNNNNNNDHSQPKSSRVPGRQSNVRDHETFGRYVFTDMELKKANEAIPIFARVNIGFIVDETEEVVNRDVMVGVKAYVHRAPSHELITDVYNCVINKRKFLKAVKFVTGEERSLSDLMFGIKELRSDALDAKSGAGQWRSAFKRRRRWAKMSIPYLTKEYTPNGTIVMTMNEVNYIKDEYGIDIMKPDHVKMIMDSDFLLGFVIIDQDNEVVYVTYDGHGYGFQTYTYSMLEREQQTSDRMMRELYRSLSH